ncbi:hypothetical protein HRbin21_01103 [bacterium HR21]|nr:hypothetical protein HRbin21_01103 [bacterium HR21]
MTHTSIVLLGLGLLVSSLWAQSPTEYTRRSLLRIASGELDAVRRELPDWLARYPNDPAILFLHAATLSDAQQAVALYERLVRDFPRSEWTDDALCRLVQYYALRRDSLRASQFFEQLRRDFPTSDFLPLAWEVLRTTIGSPAETPPRKAAAERYALQVGLFRTRELAEHEVERLRRRRLRATILEKLWQNQLHFAVIVGDYSSREAAEKSRATVAAQCRCQPIVVERP